MSVRHVAKTTPGRATAHLLGNLPWEIRLDGVCAEWVDHPCFAWLEYNIGPCGEDWYNSLSEYAALTKNCAAAAQVWMRKAPFVVYFRRREDAALFRLAFDGGR